MRHAGSVSNYDFRQAHTLSADQLRELNDHCASLCRALQRYVPESTGLPARFATEQLTSTTYEGYLDTLPESPILAVCEWLPGASPTVWQLDADPAFAYMDAMLGGDGLGGLGLERELTVLERALVAQIVEEFTATWADSWHALEATRPRTLDVRQTVGRLGTVSLQEPVMACILSCTVAQASGHIRVALPTVVLRGLLRQSAAPQGPPRLPSPQHSATITNLGKCHVTITVRLARTKLTVRRVSALQIGDVVPLDRGPRDPLDIEIAGRPKFRGISGLVNGHLAVRIVGPWDS